MFNVTFYLVVDFFLSAVHAATQWQERALHVWKLENAKVNGRFTVNKLVERLM